jgi:hypothetical protein
MHRGHFEGMPRRRAINTTPSQTANVIAAKLGKATFSKAT